MLKTPVMIAEVVTAAACLAFAVLLFFNPDDPREVQAGPAAAFPEEAAAAVDACEKARGNNCAGGGGGEAATTTTAPGGGEETATTEAENEGQAGDVVYADSCASCHGREGGGGIGPSLEDVDDVELVITTVTDGRGGMPSFEGRLQEAEIEAVAEYVVNDL
ncbi:MAG: c-type cytochrome [Acidimicrobiales bacterium]